MMSFYLNAESYTWKNALLWGNCRDHFSEGKSGNFKNRIVHWIIAASECLPIIGQIVSIVEKVLFSLFRTHTDEAAVPLTQSPNLETQSPNQPAVDKKPKVIRRPPFPMIMNREVLASRASDHSILTVQTPDGPIISANVMCCGEDYDPNMANSFRINPYTVEGRRERFENMVAQLKHSKEQVNRPIIALQEFPRRSSTGSGELEFMLRQEFRDYREPVSNNWTSDLVTHIC